MIFYVYKVSETLTESIFNVYYEYQQIIFLDPGGHPLGDPPLGRTSPEGRLPWGYPPRLIEISWIQGSPQISINIVPKTL